MKLFTLIVLIATVLPVMSAPIPKEVSKTPPLDGRWSIEKYSSNGNVIALKDYTWEIQGDQITVIRSSAPVPTNLDVRLKPRKDISANAYDYTTSSNTNRECCVEVTADTLKVCMVTDATKTRPEKIEAGPGVIYFEFKRVK